MKDYCRHGRECGGKLLVEGAGKADETGILMMYAAAQ